MATLKIKATAHGAVPRELQDVDSACWHDPGEFSRWCAREQIEEPASVPTWPQRFQGGLNGWAKLHNVRDLHDRDKLTELKIPFVGALERAKATFELNSR